MDRILEITLLYDFYGDLLTEKQKQIFDMHFQEDLSYGEIGEILNISRQAAYDRVKSVERQLCKYEEKLMLMSKFSKGRECLENIEGILKKRVNEDVGQEFQRDLRKVMEMTHEIKDWM